MADPVVHVIDDDEAARDALRFLLMTARRNVHAYASAQEFLAAAAAPGCIVTDVRMPDMTGLELLTELKRRGVSHPVIVITGHGDVALAVDAMKAGAADFLEKPYDDEKLLRAVDAALAAQANADAQDAERAKVIERITPSPRARKRCCRGLSPAERTK